jgi:probable O-glycosylation ligase (exosortase A-associated)
MGVMFLRSRGKLPMIAFGILAAPAAVYFMPEEWWNRMFSIGDYEEDVSAQGRLTIWRVCFQIGMSSIFGGGFVANIYQHIVQRFDPTVAQRAAHSIYFEVFAEHGVIGFALWSAIMIVGLVNARYLIRAGKKRPEYTWAADFGRMAQAALAAFLVGGAFLSLGYWIQTFLILAALAASCRLIRLELREADRASRPSPAPLAITTRPAVAG